ncbi:MAG: H-NS histone family protein [Pseudomonadota bacterium]
MKDIDLSKMSKAELTTLHKKVGKAIESFDERARQDALAELESKAKELGFSLAELTGAKKAKTVNPPKYRNPEDPTQTWTGRGRQPDWIKAAKSAGKDLAKFEI